GQVCRGERVPVQSGHDVARRLSRTRCVRPRLPSAPGCAGKGPERRSDALSTGGTIEWPTFDQTRPGAFQDFSGTVHERPSHPALVGVQRLRTPRLSPPSTPPERDDVAGKDGGGGSGGAWAPVPAGKSSAPIGIERRRREEKNDSPSARMP